MGFRIFLRRNHRWFSRFPSFLVIIRAFPEKLPRLCKKLPRFSENLRRFFQNFPRFSRKLLSFFSKYYPYTSTKKSKFGEKYSQDRRTPFLLPFYFLVPLCFTRQFVKVVKAKSAKLLYVRARVSACAIIITITRNDNDN